MELDLSLTEIFLEFSKESLIFVLVVLEGIYSSLLLQSYWCCGQPLPNFSWEAGNFIRGIWFKPNLDLNRLRIFITHQLFHWNKTRNCRRNIHNIKAATVNWHLIILLLVVSANKWNPNCGNGTEFLWTLSRRGSDTLVGQKWEVWLLLHKGNYCEALKKKKSLGFPVFFQEHRRRKLFEISCKA